MYQICYCAASCCRTKPKCVSARLRSRTWQRGMLASDEHTQCWQSNIHCCSPSLPDVQAEAISTPLPTCHSEKTPAEKGPVYESGTKLLKAFMALTPAFEAARGQGGHDPELQCHIDTRVKEAYNVAVDVAICGYHKDVSMPQDNTLASAVWHILLHVVFGSSCCDSCGLP